MHDEFRKSITYCARIDEKSGRILDIRISDGRKNNMYIERLKEIEIKLKEKTIALNELEKLVGKKIYITNSNEKISFRVNKYIFRWNNGVD